MNPAIVSALIAAAGTAAASGINAISTARRNKLQIAENERAFAREQAAVREQNIYNSPAQQVARLAASGLNPQMAYGNGDVVSSTQNDVARYTPAPIEAPQFDASGVVNSAVQVREQFNKNSLARSLAALQDSQALLNTTTADINRKDLEYLTDTLGFRVDSVRRNLEILGQQKDINDQTIQKLKTENKLALEYLSQEQWNTLMSEGRFDMLMVQLDMTKEQFNQLREIFPAKLALMNSEEALNWSKSAEAREYITTFGSLIDQRRSEQRLNNARSSDLEAENRAWSPGLRKERARTNAFGTFNSSTAVGPIKWSSSGRYYSGRPFNNRYAETGMRESYWDAERGLVSTAVK